MHDKNEAPATPPAKPLIYTKRTGSKASRNGGIWIEYILKCAKDSGLCIVRIGADRIQIRKKVIMSETNNKERKTGRIILGVIAVGFAVTISIPFVREERKEQRPPVIAESKAANTAQALSVDRKRIHSVTPTPSPAVSSRRSYSSSSKSRKKTTKEDPYEAHLFDDPDDYADYYAEEFAEEIGEDEDEGYWEAYDHWNYWHEMYD